MDERLVLDCPNIVTLCIDTYRADAQEGRMYHRYSDSSIPFDSLIEAFEQMDQFYDEIQFPCASTLHRSFFIDRKASRQSLKRWKMPELFEYKRKDMVMMETFEETVSHRGKNATFVVRVLYRQHASWQGEVTWVDEEKKEYFRSALELVRLIDGALNGHE